MSFNSPLSTLDNLKSLSNNEQFTKEKLHNYETYNFSKKNHPDINNNLISQTKNILVISLKPIQK